MSEDGASAADVDRSASDDHPADGSAASFDCFGTLVSVPRPPSPAEAIATRLAERGVDVPADWESAYAERYVDCPEGAELSLPVHTRQALSSRGIDAEPSVVEAAVLDAFDRDAAVLPGVEEGLAAVDAPAGVLSNCSVPGLVPRTLSQVGLLDQFDAVVTSVDVGWRKPDRRAFGAIAAELGVGVDALVHVGDDRDADGGIDRHGGRYVPVGGDLRPLSDRLAGTSVVDR